LLNTLVCAASAAAQCGPSAGDFNTACGTGTLANNEGIAGIGDSAFGYKGLLNNTTGESNTAIGAFALSTNTFGNNNTATGFWALALNTGSQNTASGSSALQYNTTGGANTATGVEALGSNTTGGGNTASGAYALENNATGFQNTASGYEALQSNTTGANNTASGIEALNGNTTGYNNTASGVAVLESNTTGDRNTASGVDALEWNTTGDNNIGLGYNAGSNITTGSNNIDIGNAGTGSDTSTVRIGIQGTQTRTYIAGVSGILSGGSESTELAVNRTTGQIGVIPSSARYKRDIHDMGGASAGVMKLRPVTFRYKSDPVGTLQYGLVAEEVARVYPELVVHDTDGKIESVRYLEFTALLLNELQKQTTKVATQQRELDALSARLDALEQQTRMATPPGLRSLASK
jgi:hypothetical protein